ncbi:oligosaccharide flippase family protein [Rhodoblastus acidophilus]|uniref:Oligosaccharide flippase family protein n=1 Tax=Candidatus Rhodoblastus alkanivorans TaxID=2954117 RepID=A0ABS9Z3C6_9HYPH|nr:oligosaccharide flippase family protein [Candidatus Rhodoblastus alkanivorans]MCI4680452.1 oligosaccharide flippase family protein [Candidatus Rhodoblastus alkanivorans]MCI4681945.1 oligosaccharide flippase family protein [Candidatus Rhodoblastus alkanivorans]MDI4642995.1 oligosaccharide flippase family protein [Rhodoblastus acidophilus]
MRHRLMKWLSWSGMDAIGRLAMLTASTAVLSRCLSPHDFGVSALALTVVTVASVLVGAPFEEALAQRKVLRLAHLRAALSASWLASLACVLLAIPLGFVLARAYHEPQFVWLLPVGMISAFFSGHADIVTGLIRRQRRFADLAKATLFGNAIGIAASVALALAGAGVWALIAQRLLVAAARAVLLQAGANVLILPSRSLGALRDLARYGGVSLADRLIDNLTYLVFNYAVGGLYGLNVLGYVNMAMRLVEPLRSAIGATGHNLAFSFLTRLQEDPERLSARARTIVSHAALAIAPVFVGLAAVTPILLPLIAGPGWDEAVVIGACLALGTAICLPARLVITALCARGRPEYSLVANIAAFGLTMAVLVFAAGFGPVSVGLSRIAGDMAQAAVAIVAAPRLLGWSRRERFFALAPAWALAALMGLVVTRLAPVLPHFNRPASLAVLIGAGVAVYAVFLALFARQKLAGLTGILALRARPAQS